MVGPVRPQFVLFGSSIVKRSFDPEVRGWGATLANLYARQADVDLRGYDSWNSRQALEVVDRVFPKHSAVQPSLVIVYFGGNDADDPEVIQGNHVPLSEYVKNMRKIATHLLSLSKTTRLIFLSAPPVNEEQIYEHFGEYIGRTNAFLRAYSEACVTLCQEMGIKVIDMFAAFQKEKDWKTTCFIEGIHFTATGNKIVANEILNVLKEAEWVPSLYYESLPSEFEELGSLDYKSLPIEFGLECFSHNPEIVYGKTTYYNKSELWPLNLKPSKILRKPGYMDKPTSFEIIVTLLRRIVLFMLCCFILVLFLYSLRCHK